MRGFPSGPRAVMAWVVIAVTVVLAVYGLVQVGQIVTAPLPATSTTVTTS